MSEMYPAVAPGRVVARTRGDRRRYARRVDEHTLRSRSLWLDQLDGPLVPRAPLGGDVDVDVAIIGGGYSGLWSAYALLTADPSLRVLVVEREMIGFGASGRNGGWCVGELAGGLEGAVNTWGRDAGVAMTQAIIDTVDEIGSVVAKEQIDCGFEPGGVIRVARTSPQRDRQRAEVDEYHRVGFGDDVLRLLDAGEATGRLAATDVLGGILYAPGARVQPARLARGLADVVERLGGTIVEETAAVDVIAGSAASRPAILTERGVVRADVVVRATEAYTRDLPGLRRSLVPLYSLMVATAPLDAATWDSIGLRDRETFADDRRMVIYGQRTPDDRIAFGGRGAALSVRLRHRPGDGVVVRCPRPHRRDARRVVAADRGRGDHPSLGWRPCGAARLAAVGRARPVDGTRMGRRLRRGGGRCSQSGRANGRRSRPATGLPARVPAVGAAPLPSVGARAAEVERDQRRSPACCVDRRPGVRTSANASSCFSPRPDRGMIR